MCLRDHGLVGLYLYFDSAGFVFGCTVVYVGCVLLLVCLFWYLVVVGVALGVCLGFMSLVICVVWVLGLVEAGLLGSVVYSSLLFCCWFVPFCFAIVLAFCCVC